MKDDYFKRFANDTWVKNKGESRPYYYVIEDTDGILWMIPLTTQTENLKSKIKNEEEKRGEGNCIFFHIGIVAGKERGFKILDLFPVTEGYIQRPYTIGKMPYIVKTSSLNKELRAKAMKVLALMKQGILLDKRRVLDIAEVLRCESIREETSE